MLQELLLLLLIILKVEASVQEENSRISKIVFNVFNKTIIKILTFYYFLPPPRAKKRRLFEADVQNISGLTLFQINKSAEILILKLMSCQSSQIPFFLGHPVFTIYN